MKYFVNKIQNEQKKALMGFLSLLSSGFLSAFCFALITSERWPIIKPNLVIFIVLYVQWQTLGLTISKLGIEQVVFAIVSQNERIYFNSRRYVVYKVLPLAVVFSLYIFFIVSPLAALITFLTILLDAESLIIMSDLNARKLYLINSIANLLNYPLFFLIIFMMIVFFEIGIKEILMVFLLTSFLRWLWLNCNRTTKLDMKEVFCKANIEMGIWQVLNYLIFRIDQIVLGAIGLNLENVYNEQFIRQYIFMAKYPELVSGIMVVAGTVIFPKVFISYPIYPQVIYKQFQKYIVWIVSFVVILFVLWFFYISIWSGEHISWNFAIPFLINSIFIFGVNNITYSMIRQGYLVGLLRNLSCSITIGLLIVLVFYVTKQVIILTWVIPIQLILFTFFVFIFPWGRRRELYE